MRHLVVTCMLVHKCLFTCFVSTGLGAVDISLPTLLFLYPKAPECCLEIVAQKEAQHQLHHLWLLFIQEAYTKSFFTDFCTLQKPSKIAILNMLQSWLLGLDKLFGRGDQPTGLFLKSLMLSAIYWPSSATAVALWMCCHPNWGENGDGEVCKSLCKAPRTDSSSFLSSEWTKVFPNFPKDLLSSSLSAWRLGTCSKLKNNNHLSPQTVSRFQL